MSMPVREMDSYGSAATLQQKKSNKISEQENLSGISKAEINDSETTSPLVFIKKLFF
jgi:hypothetical protein